MTSAWRCVRRLGALVATVLVAVALGHVFLSASVDEVPLGEVLRGTPAWIGDVLRGDLGETPGGAARRPARSATTSRCARPTRPRP